MPKYKFMIEELNCYSVYIEAEDSDTAQDIFDSREDWYEQSTDEDSGCNVNIEMYECGPTCQADEWIPEEQKEHEPNE